MDAGPTGVKDGTIVQCRYFLEIVATDEWKAWVAAAGGDLPRLHEHLRQQCRLRKLTVHTLSKKSRLVINMYYAHH